MSLISTVVKPVHREGYRFIAGFAAATLAAVPRLRPARRRRPRADGLVLLLLPRPAAGDADARGARRQPGRRRGLDDRAGRAAGGARPRPGAAHAGQRVHERLRLSREPRRRSRAGWRASPTTPAASSTPPSTRRATRTSATASSSRWPTQRPRRRPDRGARRSAHRMLFVGEGATLLTGERFGLIRFGSRLDVYLPDGVAPLVCEGQATVAGETVLSQPRLLRRTGAHRRDPLMGDGRAAGCRCCSWCRTSSPSSGSAPG